MINLLQRQRPASLLPRTNLGFPPLDESFWSRFWDDYSFRSPFRAMTSFSADWMPDINISETEKEFTVEANVPGYEPKDIEVEIEDNVLTIKGDMKKEVEEKKKNYVRQECCAGSFFRQIALPLIDEAKATCKTKNGRLTIILPKKEVMKTENKASKLVIES